MKAVVPSRLLVCRKSKLLECKYQNEYAGNPRKSKTRLIFAEALLLTNFSFFFFALNIVHSNLDPGHLTSIFHVKQIGKIAKELQKQEAVF